MTDALGIIVAAAIAASPLAPDTAAPHQRARLEPHRSLSDRLRTKSCASDYAQKAMLRHALHRAAPRHALQRDAPAAAAAARRTYLAQPKQRWHLIDASQGVSVGRLAAAIAPVLRGKHKPGFEPHRHEHGDNVVVVNADRLVFTGKKWKQKLYRHHTGYMGGLKERTAADLQRRKPGEVLRRAVLGMLPKNKLRTIFIRRLWIYPGAEHPHTNVAP